MRYCDHFTKNNTVRADAQIVRHLLFERRKRKDMPGHGYRQKRHQGLCPPPLVNNCHDTVSDGKPQKQHRDNLRPQRNGAMLSEIANILAQSRMVYQPPVESWRPLEVESCRKQQQRGSRQQGNKDSQNAKTQR